MARLYTKGGDAGHTTLCGGERVGKTDMRVAACGDVDELNCHIGVLQSIMGGNGEQTTLACIQRNLFLIGTRLPETPASAAQRVGSDDLALIEHAIDRLQEATPPTDTFILPGGCRAAAQSHVCRAVCRRAERSVAQVAQHYHIEPIIMQYINRLSDYFFILAMNLNFIAQVPEKKLYISCK